MTAHVLSSIDIEALAGKYDNLRRPDALTPHQLLRTLHREIDKVILPCLTSLQERSILAEDALSEFAKQITERTKPVVEESVRKAKQVEKTSKEIDRELEQIQRELELVPPGSARHNQLLKLQKICAGDYDLLLSRLEGYDKQIGSLQERIKVLIPAAKEVHERLTAILGRFRRNMYWLALVGVTSQFIIALPFAIALATTLAFDRSTRVLEIVTSKFAPNEYHDVVLLLLFGLQALMLTPADDVIVTKLCWRNFDRTMKVVRSLLIEVRSAEADLAEAEEKMSVLSFDTSTV